MAKKKKTTKKNTIKKESPKNKKIEWLEGFKKEQEKKGIKISFGMESKEKRYFKFPPFNDFIGGILKGSWVVLWGIEGSGKTTAALDLIAVQLGLAEQLDEFVVIADVEGTLIGNSEWLEKHGIDIKHPRLIILHGKSMEEICDALLTMIKNDIKGIYLIDSISAMAPKGEMEDRKGNQRGMENDTVGLRARQQNKLGRLAIGSGFALKDITIVLVGQVYTGISSYGAPLTLSLGMGMKHLSFLRLKFSRGPRAGWPTRRIDGKDVHYGFTSQIMIEKVKQDNASPEGSILQVPFIQNHGFHYASYLYNKLKIEGRIVSVGKSITFDGETKFNKGKAEMEAWLYDTPEIAEKELLELLKKEM